MQGPGAWIFDVVGGCADYAVRLCVYGGAVLACWLHEIFMLFRSSRLRVIPFTLLSLPMHGPWDGTSYETKSALLHARTHAHARTAGADALSSADHTCCAL